MTSLFEKRGTESSSLAKLPTTLEYTGEFGPEIICFVPFINWLNSENHLEDKKIITYAGMRPFYYFLDDTQFEEKRERRCYVPREKRPTYLPNISEKAATPRSQEIFPNYRKRYGGQFGAKFEKPLLVVHNKYCDEWNVGPVNFIPLDILDRIFSELKRSYQIVYFRDGQGSFDLEDLGFSPDHNRPFQFADDVILRRHPEVISFQALAFEQRQHHSYNDLKLIVFSDCHNFISSQGGGSHLCSLFPCSTLLVMHRSGAEIRHAYHDGFYRYASSPPPELFVAKNNKEFLEALGIFANPSAKKYLLNKFDPRRLRDPDHQPGSPAEW
jgi:hypothetical protein